MKTLSLIIPTYNVEDYLGKCLNSLIVDRKDLEVLIIIDGSKDGSCEIAKSYQERYPDVFYVIEKENGHYGSCVNKGLSVARGKYVKVLDADDSFSPFFNDFLDFLSRINIDVVLTDYVSVDEDDVVLRRRSFPFKSKIKMNLNEFISGGISVMHHATITYRTELLREISYHQTEGISYTDLEWTSLPFRLVESIVYYPEVLYRYLKGRRGQTVDIEYRSKNMWMENKVVLGLAHYYESFKLNIGVNNRIILKTIIADMISQVYKHYTLNYPKKLNESELKEFDKRLLSSSEELYQAVEFAIDERRFGSFYYIKDFRSKGTRRQLKYYYYDLCKFAGRLLQNKEEI